MCMLEFMSANSFFNVITSCKNTRYGTVVSFLKFDTMAVPAIESNYFVKAIFHKATKGGQADILFEVCVRSFHLFMQQSLFLKIKHDFLLQKNKKNDMCALQCAIKGC